LRLRNREASLRRAAREHDCMSCSLEAAEAAFVADCEGRP